MASTKLSSCEVLHHFKMQKTKTKLRLGAGLLGSGCNAGHCQPWREHASAWALWRENGKGEKMDQWCGSVDKKSIDYCVKLDSRF